jgi:exosortase family protein XrtM
VKEALAKLDPRLKRCALFVALFLAATTANYVARPHIAPVLNGDINAKNAARLVNLLTPDAAVTVTGFSIGNQHAVVEVANGCDGLDALLLLLAAVLAFPMEPRRKLLGAVIGVTLVLGLNLARIAGLWYCQRYWPSSFQTMHETVGQTVLIVACVLFLATWTGLFSGARLRRA